MRPGSDGLLDRLARVNPVPLSRLEGLAASTAARDLFDRIVAEPPPSTGVPQRPRKKRRGQMWVGLAAGLVVLALLLTQFGTQNRTPRARAAEALNAAAAVAAEQAPAPATGEYRYTKTVVTDRITSEFEGQLWTALVPSTQETWVAPDGSGRIRTVTGEPVFLGERDRALWEAAGSPSLGSGASDQTFGPGELGYEDLSGLPTDPESLATELRRRAESTGVPASIQMLELVGNLLRQPGASPELRAALYRVAAGVEGIELVGQVTDQAGRLGTAVGIVSEDAGARIRTTLVFDPQSSELLAEETVLLERVPWVDAGPPAVIGYRLYLASELVESTSERPSTRFRNVEAVAEAGYRLSSPEGHGRV